jgi:hypothetical protein
MIGFPSGLPAVRTAVPSDEVPTTHEVKPPTDFLLSHRTHFPCELLLLLLTVGVLAPGKLAAGAVGAPVRASSGHVGCSQS